MPRRLRRISNVSTRDQLSGSSGSGASRKSPSVNVVGNPATDRDLTASPPSSVQTLGPSKGWLLASFPFTQARASYDNELHLPRSWKAERPVTELEMKEFSWLPKYGLNWKATFGKGGRAMGPVWQTTDRACILVDVEGKVMSSFKNWSDLVGVNARKIVGRSLKDVMNDPKTLNINTQRGLFADLMRRVQKMREAPDRRYSEDCYLVQKPNSQYFLSHFRMEAILEKKYVVVVCLATADLSLAAESGK